MARETGLGEAAKASPVVVATQGQELAASHSYHSMTFDFIIHIFWQINAVQMCLLLKRYKNHIDTYIGFINSASFFWGLVKYLLIEVLLGMVLALALETS